MSLKGHIHISRIEPHPGNIRADVGDVSELAASIRTQGILQPLVVQQSPGHPGHYQVLAGHRRLAAAKLLRLDTVPATFRDTPAEPRQAQARAVEIMLVENCQRRDLSAIEKAEAMGALRDRHGMTAAVIARRIGMSDSTVSYFLSLLELDEATRARVADGTVPVKDAMRAVRATRKASRRGTGPGRPAQAQPAWLTSRHRLARAARALCDQAAHTSRPPVGNVACGQCWEQAIRDDERQAVAPDPEPDRLTVREERMQLLAGMRVHTGSSAVVPPGHISAREAGERLGVSARTVERYKRDLAEVAS